MELTDHEVDTLKRNIRSAVVWQSVVENAQRENNYDLLDNSMRWHDNAAKVVNSILGQTLVLYRE